MKKAVEIRRLLKAIELTEKRLGGLTTRLWKLVGPSNEEENLALDSASYFDEFREPIFSDLEVLRWVLSYREENEE